MSLAFNDLELRSLNWLKDNIDSDVVSIADFLKIVDTRTRISHKFNVDMTLLALATEGLITIKIDKVNQQYSDFRITREGLIALRQRYIDRVHRVRD